MPKNYLWVVPSRENANDSEKTKKTKNKKKKEIILMHAWIAVVGRQIHVHYSSC